MTVHELANQLDHTKNNYILGLASFAILQSEASYPLLEARAAIFGPYSVSFGQVSKLLQNPADRVIALREYQKMLMRTLIKESFEHIKDYCTLTDQFAALKAEPWYEFARLIRNFLAHNCRFEFNKYDAERLPVKWRNKTITIDLDRKTPDFSFFGEVETWELFQDFENFVKNRLK